MTERDLDQWTAWRVQEDQRLYARYGKPLEPDHTGEFLSIGPQGQTLLGPDGNALFQQAIEAFGSGEFGFFRVGHPVLEKWRKISP